MRKTSIRNMNKYGRRSNSRRGLRGVSKIQLYYHNNINNKCKERFHIVYITVSTTILPPCSYYFLSNRPCYTHLHYEPYMHYYMYKVEKTEMQSSCMQKQQAHKFGHTHASWDHYLAVELSTRRIPSLSISITGKISQWIPQLVSHTHTESWCRKMIIIITIICVCQPLTKFFYS